MRGVWVLLAAALVVAACGGDEPSEAALPSGSSTGPGGADAATGAVLEDSGQVAVACLAESRKCADSETLKRCTAAGDGWLLEACPAGTVCAAGACRLLSCAPGEPLGTCFGPSAMNVCDATGTEVEHRFCDAAAPVCIDGECRDLACSPGAVQCKGVGAVEQCRDDGTGYDVIEVCGEGGLCTDGKCYTACDLDVKQNTYLGCEYWIVDLDNIEAGQSQAVAAVVSNPSETEAVTVAITNMTDASDLALGDPSVPPRGQKTFMIPTGYDLDGTTLTRQSFRLRASGPVTVHQFNPLNAASVFSNDASLLLPANSAGKAFYVLSWPQRQADGDTGNVPLRGFATVVAVEPGETVVTVYPTTLVELSDTLEPLTPFAENQFSLSYGQVLNLETGGGLSGPDLTGSKITANRRIAVFGGHECANVPLVVAGGNFKGADFCDHIEQQLFPLETWGSQAVADRYEPRSDGQADVWRIVAGEDGTVVSTDPPQPEVNDLTLDAGEYAQFESGESFVVSATGPISVGHYLKSSNYAGFATDEVCSQGIGETGIGDPALSSAVSTVQFRTDYIVLTPDNYERNYINIIAPVGAQITLDGAPAALTATPVGLTSWTVTALEVGAGVHRLEAAVAFGVTAYGYACDVSYAYPGGLNLESQ